MKRKQHIKIKSVLFFIVMASCICIGFSWMNINVKKWSSCALYPFLMVNSYVISPVKNLVVYMQDIKKLESKIDVLQQERERLLEQNIQLHASIDYLDDIMELQEFKNKLTSPGKIVRVLYRHFSDKEHYFFIEGGANNNMQKDMVIVYANNIVGKIVEVYPWYSKVCLVSDRQCKVAAFCSGTKSRGIHEGTNLDNGQLTYVNHYVNIKKEDLILSSGEGLIFPYGYALGKISQCTKEQLYWQVTTEPLIDLKQIRYCMALLKDNENNETKVTA